jgi:hypothetical protein
MREGYKRKCVETASGSVDTAHAWVSGGVNGTPTWILKQTELRTCIKTSSFIIR